MKKTKIISCILAFVMIVSAIVMLIIGLIRKTFNVKWLDDYALPISMIAGMALAIPITNLVNMIVGA